MLKAHPRLGPFHHAELAQAMGVRVKRVVNYGTYVVVYRLRDPQTVEFVRVLHISRDIQRFLI